MLTDNQWRRFNWLDNEITHFGLDSLTNYEFDEYYRLALRVTWYCDTLA